MVFHPDDTIVAIATPSGRGGIGVVRLSGPEAVEVVARISDVEPPLAPRHATLATVRASEGGRDEAILTFFPGPHSYTAEDVVEISAHGSPWLLRAIVDACIRSGARLAQPGEFTLRAYLNGRIDLVQAEAVKDLVDAVTPLQARAAYDQLEGTLTGAIREIDAALFDLNARLEASLDFPEEGYHFLEPEGATRDLNALGARLSSLLADAARGRLIREGAHVVIAGRPNAGKSSLFNALAGAGRAIVTEVPGTTRDLLTERVELEGLPVTLVDTAGVRAAASDIVEAEGIARAAAARAVATLLVVVLDRSRPLTAEDRALVDEAVATRGLVVANKIDLPAAWDEEDEPAALGTSAATGAGLDLLRSAIVRSLSGREPSTDTPAVTNLRHAHLLEEAREAIVRASRASQSRASEEFVLADLRAARSALEEITGARTADDTLAAIFSKFCIGK